VLCGYFVTFRPFVLQPDYSASPNMLRMRIIPCYTVPLVFCVCVCERERERETERQREREGTVRSPVQPFQWE
jgi:hypothetical protein